MPDITLMTTVQLADHTHLDVLTPLLDAYRRFYGRPSDAASARRFQQARFDRGDAHVLIAVDDDGVGVGFAQLFPVPSTTDLAIRWILNDLFVRPESRRRGIATQLLDAARELAQRHGVPTLMLRTQVDNVAAQSCYRALGWQRDEAFQSYLLNV